MKLIDQHTKGIMEECKSRARDHGLSFDNETVEYIVTNRDMIDLSPKLMIPTLYEYWVNDVEVLKGRGRYKVYPSNPYETVINSRPAISFYNDNNPDWLNIMIFYHVLAHIDFFQNNRHFSNTWGDDFVGQALADKRLIEMLRSEHGRWVDYVIDFSRAIDNLVGYFSDLNFGIYPSSMNPPSRIDYYFQTFLQETVSVDNHFLYRETERYNKLLSENGDMAEALFFSEVKKKYPEFQAKYEKENGREKEPRTDIMEYVLKNSPYLKKEENSWMKSVITIIRNTSLYFSPQIRTKIMNEGWASFWHDRLFRIDDRISGHEIAYAKINAMVTSVSRVGLNPYAIGLRLFEHVYNLADKGRLSFDFQKLHGIEQRKEFDTKDGKGEEIIFKIRNLFNDFSMISTFVDQDFVTENRLFVTGRRLDAERGVFQYYVKSRKAEDYKKMLVDSLYHPPVIHVDEENTQDNQLVLKHRFENRQLVKSYIPDTLMALSFLWGGDVSLDTTEIVVKGEQEERTMKPVRYTIKNKIVEKKDLQDV